MRRCRRGRRHVVRFAHPDAARRARCAGRDHARRPRRTRLGAVVGDRRVRDRHGALLPDRHPDRPTRADRCAGPRLVGRAQQPEQPSSQPRHPGVGAGLCGGSGVRTGGPFAARIRLVAPGASTGCVPRFRPARSGAGDRRCRARVRRGPRPSQSHLTDRAAVPPGRERARVARSARRAGQLRGDPPRRKDVCAGGASAAGSLRVVRGDRVESGTAIGECGNSGNSTEPHLHIQAMDRPSAWIAAGRPLLIDSREPPANGRRLVVPATGRSASHEADR